MVVELISTTATGLIEQRIYESMTDLAEKLSLLGCSVSRYITVSDVDLEHQIRESVARVDYVILVGKDGIEDTYDGKVLCYAAGTEEQILSILKGQEKVPSLEEKAVRILREKGYTITTAESCTGGKLAGRILNVSGASEVYNEGYVTYANEAKEKLVGVSHETLVKYGAVSEETAREMAYGAALAANADAALSVTGIAGPGGGTKEKPVGLVYIGCNVKGKIQVQKCNFSGNREQNREHSVEMALRLLLSQLQQES